MSEPPVWNLQQLVVDAQRARARFREERLLEPLEQYRAFFGQFVPIIRSVIGRLDDLQNDDRAAAAVAEIVADDGARTVLRYLTGPPISEDDLRVLADTSFARSTLGAHPERAMAVRDIILRILDPFRFPWVLDGRPATAEEQDSAVTATASLVAARKVETSRRSEANKAQEAQAKEAVRSAGFVEVPSREIPFPDAAPAAGEFCGESRFGSTKGDIILRLHDQRIMAIECKVSNSAVNSYKRVNHEAANKARSWLNDFGHRTTIPAAVLSGVFNPENLVTAQEAGLSLFWSHRLSDLTHFVKLAT